jgi:hypothetical protein
MHNKNEKMIGKNHWIIDNWEDTNVPELRAYLAIIIF